ncbi:MAG: glycoside hydrolase family 13 protein [Eubacteriales bacterium]
MLDELNKMVYHNSANPSYRYPMGACKTGDSVLISIKVKTGAITSASLILKGHGGEESLPLDKKGDMWALNIKLPEDPCVLFYYFCLKTDNETYYYGSGHNRTSGRGYVYSEVPLGFQITVFLKDFKTPEWMKNGIMYQIFPDRFKMGDPLSVKLGVEYHRSLGRRIRLHENWDEYPDYTSLPGEEFYVPDDYFGGDLDGIEQSLNYLKRLGVSIIYLNPIFEADSNHRYNTANYFKIDPILGGLKSFKKLINSAKEKNIHIILDAVFSHTGADSIYFNKLGRYPAKGAYQSTESQYYSWYTFTKFPDSYKSWWGFKTLPEVNEFDPNWQETVITGKGSVVSHWIKQGASGYRLDVADELPDKVIELIRESVKSSSQDNAVIGEVWEDATTKSSYGNLRTYALGKGLDSVMNYPLRNAIVNFLEYKSTSDNLVDFLISQWQNYPRPMYYALMNMLSTHDIARIRTALASNLNIKQLTTKQQAEFNLTPAQKFLGSALERLAVSIIYSLPGMPCIYYGDETGMCGMLDPFNRATYRLEDETLLEFYQNIGAIRNTHVALRTGKCCFAALNQNVVAILRWGDETGTASDKRPKEAFLSVINRSAKKEYVVFDIQSISQCITDEEKSCLLSAMYEKADCKLTLESFKIKDGLIELSINPISALILEFK